MPPGLPNTDNDKINYIIQINVFWQFHETYVFKSVEVMLYFNLLRMCNAMGWINPFYRQSKMIVSYMNIGKSTYEASRDRLRDVGLIEFETTFGSGNTKFKIIDLRKFYGGYNGGFGGGNAGATVGGIESGTNGLSININETKPNRNIYKSFDHLKLFEDEFYKLTELGYSKGQIDDVLESIENFKDNQKYKSLFITTKIWLGKAKEVPAATPQLESITKKEKEKQFNKALEAFEVYKDKGVYTDWDTLVYDFLYKRELIVFAENDNRLPEIIQLEKDGRLPEAKQMALMAYFNDLAETGRELSDLLKPKNTIK